jgi:hypothetical protein
LADQNELQAFLPLVRYEPDAEGVKPLGFDIAFASQIS